MNSAFEIEHKNGLSRRPVFPIAAVSFVVGLLWGESLSAKYLFFLFLIILFFIIFSFYFKKYRKLICVSIFFLIGLIRIASFNETLSNTKDFLSGYVDKRIEISCTGRIENYPSVKIFNSKGSTKKVFKFYCKTTEIENFHMKAKILVYVPVSAFKRNPCKGDQIRFQAGLKYPSRFYFNRKINYRTYLNNRGVVVIAKVSGDVDIVKESFLWLSINKLRNKFLNNLNYAVENTVESEIVNTMLLGTDPSIKNHILKNFSSMGIIHILVISGLHVASLTFVIVTVFMMCGLSKRLSESLVIPVLWGYLLIVGFKVAVVRAVLMITFYFLSDFLRRDKNGVHAGVFAGLIQLLIMPRLIYDTGFQYSFLAVFALFLVYPAFIDLIEGRKKFIAKFFFMSFSIWIIVSPLVSYLNSVFYPTGFLLGMVLIFFVQIIIITGFCSIMFGCLSLFFSEIFNYFNFVFVKHILKLVDFVYGLRFTGFYFHNFHYYLLIGYFLSVIFVLLFVERKIIKALLLIFLYLSIMLVGLVGLKS